MLNMSKMHLKMFAFIFNLNHFDYTYIRKCATDVWKYSFPKYGRFEWTWQMDLSCAFIFGRLCGQMDLDPALSGGDWFKNFVGIRGNILHKEANIYSLQFVLPLFYGVIVIRGRPFPQIRKF